MKAVLVDDTSGPKFRTDYPKPVRKSGDVLVKVIRVGICKTDLEILSGYSGFKGVLGHEFLGTVSEADPDCPFPPGTRVVGEINVACQNCDICTNGGIQKRNHCPNRTVMGIVNKDGTFCEYLILPMDNLYPVPDSIPDKHAVFAEPLAAAYRIVEQMETKVTDNIAVIGDGKLGNLIAQVMSNQPHSKLTLFGKHHSKLNKVPQKNIEKVLVDDETSTKYRDCFDICIESSGNPNGIMMAGELTRPLGTIVLKTTCATGTKKFNTTTFVVKEITIVGSRCGNFNMALKGLENGNIAVEQLIDNVFQFDEAIDAIKAAGVKGTMKIQMIV